MKQKKITNIEAYDPKCIRQKDTNLFAFKKKWREIDQVIKSAVFHESPRWPVKSHYFWVGPTLLLDQLGRRGRKKTNLTESGGRAGSN